MDLYWRDSLTCPTEEEYVQMVLGSESLSKTQPSLEPSRNVSFANAFSVRMVSSLSTLSLHHDGSTDTRDWRLVQDSSQINDGEVVFRRVSPIPFLHSSTVQVETITIIHRATNLSLACTSCPQPDRTLTIATMYPWSTSSRYTFRSETIT